MSVRRRWWLLAAGALVAGLVIAVVATSVSRGPTIPPRSVQDTGFTRAADAACARVLPELRRQRPQLGERPDDEAEEVAGKVERTATSVERLAAELRGLPVAEADRARVDRWLDDWDAFVAVGRRYAAALRRGDNEAPARVAEQADPMTRRIFLFSQANGMPHCIL